MSWRSWLAEVIVTALLLGSLCACGDGEVDPPASGTPVASRARTPVASVKKGMRTPKPTKSGRRPCPTGSDGAALPCPAIAPPGTPSTTITAVQPTTTAQAPPPSEVSPEPSPEAVPTTSAPQAP
ncbi:hypothetical protein ACIBI9_03905 [Nonomuraea sp. NPDC050451]|uniref:hypothetical protein n=1 Tax=Nonomuraea sp. NPDC050451 TaxID=3364364 RepID=UPI003793764C